MEWIFLAVAAAPIVWSVTRFRRLDPRSREFRHGLLGFGLSLWVLLTVVLTYGAWQANPGRQPGYFFVYFGLTLLPACLWSGYWWVRAMRSDYRRFLGFGSSSRL
jgi:hypothetical protein